MLNNLDNLAVTKAKAITVARSIKNTHQALLEALEQSINMIWDDPNPGAIITELGNQALTVFLASQSCTVCLESISPGCTTSILAKVGTYTVNPDGTITNVVKPPAPVV